MCPMAVREIQPQVDSRAMKRRLYGTDRADAIRISTIARHYQSQGSTRGRSLLADDSRRRSEPRIRLTGILVDDGKILLVRQVLRECAHWNLPGGALEQDETCESGVARELLEETGLRVEVDRLLYVTDRFKHLGNHVVDLCFAVKRVGGRLACPGVTPDGETIAKAAMVPIDHLAGYGFSQRFVGLVKEGFPESGSYKGDFHDFYGSAPKRATG